MRPLAFLNLLMLAFMCGLVSITIDDNPENWLLLGIYILMASVLLIHPLIKIPGIDFPRRFRQIYPPLYIIGIFSTMGGLVQNMQHWRADVLLSHLDEKLVGVQPTVFLEQHLYPLLVEILSYAYALYFFLPFILIWLLWRNGKIAEITRWGCLITIVLYTNYLLYIAVPAGGPRFHVPHTRELHGVLLGNLFMHIVNSLEFNKLDVFPSAHVSATLVVLYGFIRYLKKMQALAVLATVLIAVSTVYLRYHYVADLIAGVILAVLAIIGGELYVWLWSRKSKSAERIQPVGTDASDGFQ